MLVFSSLSRMLFVLLFPSSSTIVKSYQQNIIIHIDYQHRMFMLGRPLQRVFVVWLSLAALNDKNCGQTKVDNSSISAKGNLLTFLFPEFCPAHGNLKYLLSAKSSHDSTEFHVGASISRLSNEYIIIDYHTRVHK